MQKFVIKIDHKPLKYILDSSMQNKKIKLWALCIAGYSCKTEYIEGRFNCCADLLSRLPPNGNGTGDDLSDNEPDCKDIFLR
jgi:hypothetical protein